MKVFFIALLGIIIFVVIIYLSIILRFKISLTYDEMIFNVIIKMFSIRKKLVYKLKYKDILRYINKDNKLKKIKKHNIKISTIIKPFFIKDINLYAEYCDNKYYLALEFCIVNIIFKRGVLS